MVARTVTAHAIVKLEGEDVLFLTQTGSGETVIGEEPEPFSGDIRLWGSADSRDATLRYLHSRGEDYWQPLDFQMTLNLTAPGQA